MRLWLTEVYFPISQHNIIKREDETHTICGIYYTLTPLIWFLSRNSRRSLNVWHDVRRKVFAQLCCVERQMDCASFAEGNGTSENQIGSHSMEKREKEKEEGRYWLSYVWYSMYTYTIHDSEPSPDWYYSFKKVSGFRLFYAVIVVWLSKVQDICIKRFHANEWSLLIPFTFTQSIANVRKLFFSFHHDATLIEFMKFLYIHDYFIKILHTKYVN